MVSPTQWTWVWAGSRSWWWTGKPGVLQSMGSQRVRHDWVTELNWRNTMYFSYSPWLFALLKVFYFSHLSFFPSIWNLCVPLRDNIFSYFLAIYTYKNHGSNWVLWNSTPKQHLETSLVVQWLRLHTSNAEGMGLIPGQGTKVLQATWYGPKCKTDSLANLFITSFL